MKSWEAFEYAIKNNFTLKWDEGNKCFVLRKGDLFLTFNVVGGSNLFFEYLYAAIVSLKNAIEEGK